MGGARGPVVAAAAILGAVTLIDALVPRLNFADRLPAPHVALDTAATLIALLAAFLVFGRFLRSGRLTELALTCSLGALALSELVGRASARTLYCLCRSSQWRRSTA